MSNENDQYIFRKEMNRIPNLDTLLGTISQCRKSLLRPQPSHGKGGKRRSGGSNLKASRRLSLVSIGFQNLRDWGMEIRGDH
jgi:hypothetical protein